MRWMPLAFAVLVIGSASTARAQGACSATPASPLDFLNEGGNGKGRVGEWAEYAPVHDGVPQLAATFRMQVVESPWEGETVRWVELLLDKTGRTALRMSPGREPGAPPRLYFKTNRSIFTLEPDQFPRDTAGKCDPNAAAGRSRNVKLKTVAGTFTCRHEVRGEGAQKVEIWSSNAIPLMHLAKISFLDGRGYELVAMGTNATTVFPERFDAVPFPRPDALKALVPSNPGKANAVQASMPDAAPTSTAPASTDAPQKVPELQPFKPRPQTE